METSELLSFILDKADDMKGRDIITVDVRGKSPVTDYMVLCSGTSTRHTKSIATHVANEMKKKGVPALGLEGQASGDWVLLDMGSVVLHVLVEEMRDHYQLEKLWDV
ncbi:ribosome silencing factor [Rheinheimera sp. MMS21-TC3]|uniref:ribosome silencing factor n=1 Tax=Rheinheimera sp. MMS21-TC3 TaxID=3072790 RepID=UPI0028C4766B|nr:ribosome silencing factor [Rheinheimera sp. MMS21-TC3]WNO62070.1 ribosome silencing factor [Rheinheimera sp. MMS21-TC3]